MKFSEPTEQDKIFMARMERARTQNPALYLAAIAVTHTPGTTEDIDWAEGHTRGDFKRAVKILRGLQKEAPQCAATYEDAIAFIRADWLRRKAGAAVCSSVAVGSGVGSYG